jgi:hypothetical protein
MNPQPNVCIQSQEGTPIIIIDSPTCINGCSLCSSDDDCIEIGGIISNIEQCKRMKSACKEETRDEARKGPLCNIFIVHKV